VSSENEELAVKGREGSLRTEYRLPIKGSASTREIGLEIDAEEGIKPRGGQMVLTRRDDGRTRDVFGEDIDAGPQERVQNQGRLAYLVRLITLRCLVGDLSRRKSQPNSEGYEHDDHERRADAEGKERSF
jgi:hypothetical protein